MKNTRLAWMLALLLLGTSCRTDDSDSATPPETVRPFTLEEALAACEQSRSQTRAADDEGVLAPGETDIFWETAAYSQNEYGASYDVEIFVDRCYRTVWTLPDGRSLGDLILPRLVVVKAAEIYERTTTAYLAYYIPDPDESRSPVDDPAAGLLNSLPKPGFSGRILYTSLAGFPVAAAKYGDGELLDHAFLFEETDSLSILRSIEHYNRLVADIRVSPVRENGYEETRSNPNDGTTEETTAETTDKIKDGGEVGEVVVVASPKRPKLDITPDIDWKNFRPTDPVGLVPPGRPGAGPGGNSGRDNSDSDDSNKDGYSKNPNIRVYDDVTQELLDELYDDCMGQTLLNSIKNVSIYIDDIPQADLDRYSSDKLDQYLGKNGALPIYNNGTLETVKIFFADGGANGRKRGYVLMEELIHAYQRQALSRDDYNNQKLNNEIEAKVGWVLYQERKYSMEHTETNYDRQLGKGGIRIFQALSGLRQTPSDPLFSQLYMRAIKSLRTIGSYSNIEKYPESESARDFDLLLDLMKNCLQL